ncbi:hypothetical protein Dda_3587 [Drechslerella dactyloides]|uniref:Uncharacterized protein n=1 Tax=Drechslerella dactyloides TaxID=74499 RepID=A0AAD6J2J2_DREDA|nr:hypothetical protein Dda_3587 [Drechslerella dactyloides]
MSSRNTTSTLSKPKLQLKPPAGQMQPHAQPGHLPPSPSTSPDSSLLDQYRLHSAPQPKRFPLKNLRRKLPQPNLHEVASNSDVRRQAYDLSQSPTARRVCAGYDGSDENDTVNIADLQAKIALLTQNLLSAEEALKKAEGEREAWKDRARTLEQRNRSLNRENRDIKVRNGELEHQEAKRKAAAEKKKNEAEESTSNLSTGSRRRKRQSRSSIIYKDESRTVRALIMHHWNLQAELATGSGKESDWCGCVASNTVRALLKNGSSRSSSVQQAKGFDEVARGSPSGSHVDTKAEEPIEEKIPSVRRQQPLHPHPEIVDDAKKQRKEALKKRIRETRGYVEGLKKENDVLEGLLVVDEQRRGRQR